MILFLLRNTCVIRIVCLYYVVMIVFCCDSICLSFAIVYVYHFVLFVCFVFVSFIVGGEKCSFLNKSIEQGLNLSRS